MAPARWGDEEDDSSTEGDSELPSTNATQETTASGLAIPLPHTSKLDSKGVKTVTTFRADPSNPNQILKTVTKIRVYVDTVRENVAVERRRKWKRFGAAADSIDESNVTIQSRDDVCIEDPNADVDKTDDDAGKALAGNLNAFWLKQQRRQLERKYDVDTTVDGNGEEGKVEADGWTKVGAEGGLGGAKAAGGKYVPPAARGGAAGLGGKSLSAMAERVGDAGPRGGTGVDRDQNTIRVTNISEDTTEADLQELFQPFGRISRVYLAKDKETLQSRGFAFVSFVHRDDAAKAMDRLQGYGYDHLILKLEWARPSAPRDPGKEGTQFRSGYGQALAQDTKEKVSYASNLTANR